VSRLQEGQHMAFGKRTPIGYGGIERRGMFRERSPVPGHILLPSGQIIQCHIKDISKTGAMIYVQSILGLPAQFALEQDGIRRQARVLRREPTRLAVQFL
jgi:PilZ domain